MSAELTARQRDVLMAIENFIRDEEMPPTMRELASILGVTSTNGISEHLAALEKKGYVRRKNKLRARNFAN